MRLTPHQSKNCSDRRALVLPSSRESPSIAAGMACSICLWEPRSFQPADGLLALKRLDEADQTRNAEDLNWALTIGFVYGFAPEHLDILRRLVDVDWHYSHEDVVSALQTSPTADTVEPLFRATQWIPKSLEYDDSRALAVKAIWALGKIPGAETETKLEALARSDNDILRKTAEEQLERRRRTT